MQVATTSTKLMIARSWIALQAGRRSPPIGMKIASVEQAKEVRHPLVQHEHSWTKSTGAFAT